MSNNMNRKKPGRTNAPALVGGYDGLSSELARLSRLDLDGLRLAWRHVFAKLAPAHLPKPLLVRIIAYRRQVIASGDLDRKVQQILDRALGQKDPGASRRLKSTVLKSGTQLVREWSGDLHRVTVLENGFAWNGETYSSLTKVARAITGTPWNGPRFFGLRDKGVNERNCRFEKSVSGEQA
jgi:hypothetical protein